MNYSEAVNYIENLQAEAGSDLSLKQVKYLADMIGNPENKSRIIHIAGTNGKGSVCSFLNTMLIKSQKSVGLFTSPHLVHMNERIRINGEMISNQEFTDVFEKVKNAVAILESRGGVHPSFFE